MARGCLPQWCIDMEAWLYLLNLWLRLTLNRNSILFILTICNCQSNGYSSLLWSPYIPIATIVWDYWILSLIMVSPTNAQLGPEDAFETVSLKPQSDRAEIKAAAIFLFLLFVISIFPQRVQTGFVHGVWVLWRARENIQRMPETDLLTVCCFDLTTKLFFYFEFQADGKSVLHFLYSRHVGVG